MQNTPSAQDLYLLAGLSNLAIDHYHVFPAYDGRTLLIVLEDNTLTLSDANTGRLVAWNDLTPTEVDRMQQHLYLTWELQQPTKQN